MLPTPSIAARLQVLVCLTNPRALVLVSQVLNQEGFAVTTASTVEEFEEAVRFGGFCAIVTATEADLITRRISGLPFIDIRQFIHEWTDKETGQRTCLFDRASFVDQILFTAETIAPALPGCS